jgi:hypothetical protein
MLPRPHKQMFQEKQKEKKNIQWKLKGKSEWGQKSIRLLQCDCIISIGWDSVWKSDTGATVMILGVWNKEHLLPSRSQGSLFAKVRLTCLV